MYRNCPEHPTIKEILKNGEPIGLGRWISDADKDCSEFGAEQVYCISEKDYAEICFLRRKQKNNRFYSRQRLAKQD